MDGLVHRPGPRNNPCPGSQQPPLDALVQVASQASHSQPDSVTAASFKPKQTGYVASGHFSFSSVDCGINKHIPKSAKAVCASHLCGLLNLVVSDPGNLSHWQDVLHWGQAILTAPKRGGRKHNVALTIRKRVAGSTHALGPIEAT